ncbi:hypothetical protein YC2023_075915 [Brassica napus]
MEEPCSVGASVCRSSNKLLMSFVCFYHGPEVLCFVVHCLLYHGPLVSITLYWRIKIYKFLNEMRNTYLIIKK